MVETHKPVNNLFSDGVQEEITENFMTTRQVCVAGGVTPPAVHKWVRTGKLCALRVGAGRGSNVAGIRLFDRVEVEKFLKQREAKLARKRKK